MAWFVGSLTILWYCLKGHEGSHVVKERPLVHHEDHADVHRHAWCTTVGMWEYATYGESGEELPSPECIQRLLHKLAAVA